MASGEVLLMRGKIFFFWIRALLPVLWFCVSVMSFLTENVNSYAFQLPRRVLSTVSWWLISILWFSCITLVTQVQLSVVLLVLQLGLEVTAMFPKLKLLSVLFWLWLYRKCNLFVNEAAVLEVWHTAVLKCHGSATGAVLGSCWVSLWVCFSFSMFFFSSFKFFWVSSDFDLSCFLFFFFLFFFKQDQGIRLFQAKLWKVFPIGVFVCCLNRSRSDLGRGSLVIQYFFHSAEKFVEGSYQYLIAFKNKNKTPQNCSSF